MPLAWLPQSFLLLLAQTGSRLGALEIVLVVLFGIVLVVACGGIAYGIWQSRREREQGPELPGDGDGDTAAKRVAARRGLAFPHVTALHVAAAMGVGLPLGIFTLAFLTTGLDSEAHDTVIWIGAILVALAGVAGGTILALRAPSPTLTPTSTVARTDALENAEQPL